MILTVSSAIVSAALCSAQDDVSVEDLDARLVDAEIRKERLERELEFRQALPRSTGVDWRRIPQFDALPPEIKTATQELVAVNASQAADALEDYLSTTRIATANARDEWIKLRRQRSALELDVGKSESGGRVTSLLAQFIATEMRWLWLGGSVGLAVVCLVAWHDRRHEYRRRLHGSRGRALGLSRIINFAVVAAVIVTLTVFLLGPRLYSALLTSGTSTQDPNQRARAEAEAAEKELPEREKRVAAAKKAATEGEAGAANDSVHRVRMLLGDAIAENSVQRLLARREAEEAGRVESLHKKRDEAGLRIANFERNQRLAYVAVGCGLAGFIGYLGYRVLSASAKRQRHVERTCPKCLGEGTLRKDDAPGAVAPMMVCQNVLDNNECNFSLPANLLPLTKLCFPTLGHSRSGKTHWLAMVYRELNQGNYASQVRFERLRSQSSREFDEIVDRVLRGRLGTGGTFTASIPHPLVFQFGDNDPWGRSNVLVNMFDYSGEVTIGGDHPQRRRALSADGYFFFLDPTFSADEQNDELISFRDDVRMMRGTKAGKAINAPVALCVSKIDLFGVQGGAMPWGEDLARQFYDQLSKIDPTGNDLSLKAMRARSELIRQLTGTIWPGWNIERQIREAFGGRFMFFPMTPVGIADRECLDPSDLSRRTIDPYAIIHPLIWLLHMNGFSVTK